MTVTDNNRFGSLIGAIITLFIVLIIVSFLTWFFTPKAYVQVIDSVNDRLRITEEHLYVDDNYLLGIPSMVARWLGMQAPKEIYVPGQGELILKNIMPDSDTDHAILINLTQKDLFYLPLVYGGSNDDDLEVITTIIMPGQARVVLGGANYLGCNSSIPESISGIALGETEIRGWIAERDHDLCP